MLQQADRVQRLEKSYQYVKRYILSHQSATTGLFPTYLRLYESGSENSEEDSSAWIFDNVYTVVSVWALSVAYRKVDNDDGRTYELQQSVVKCMRGILSCYMREAVGNVEAFKLTQDPKYALSCKYDYVDGDPLKDEESRRLSIYSISLFIYFLAQFTKTGLRIIFTLDEVDFLQNLVYGIERAYRTPDYSIWDREQFKLADTIPQTSLRASSIGMAKAALEAISGMNMFGLSLQGSGGFVYVDPDALNRNRAIFTSMLPRESSNQETDILLLTVVGWPAYACLDPQLAAETELFVHEVLRGHHGYEWAAKNQAEIKQRESPAVFAQLVINEFMKGGDTSPEGLRFLDSLEATQFNTINDAALIPEMYCHPLSLNKSTPVRSTNTTPEVPHSSTNRAKRASISNVVRRTSITEPTGEGKRNCDRKNNGSDGDIERVPGHSSPLYYTSGIHSRKHSHPHIHPHSHAQTHVHTRTHARTSLHDPTYDEHTLRRSVSGNGVTGRGRRGGMDMSDHKDLGVGDEDENVTSGSTVRQHAPATAHMHQTTNEHPHWPRQNSHDHIMRHLHTREEILPNPVTTYDPIDYTESSIYAQHVHDGTFDVDLNLDPTANGTRRLNLVEDTSSTPLKNDYDWDEPTNMYADDIGVEYTPRKRRISNPRLLESKVSLTPKFEFMRGRSSSFHTENYNHEHCSHLVPNNRFCLKDQSLWLITRLLHDRVVTPGDLDPQDRRLRPLSRQGFRGYQVNDPQKTDERKKSDIVVQVALLAENERLQAVLGTYGIATQTQQQIEPIHICSPSTLIELYSHMGKNRKFSLSGRPNRPCGSLTTSKVYMIKAQTFVFYPILLDHTDFYMSLDLQLLIDKIKDELAFLADNWSCDSRPLMCLLITENMVTGEFLPEILELMASLKRGECNNVTIKMGRLQQQITTSQKEHLDFLSAPEFDSIINATSYPEMILPRLLPDRRESLSSSRQASIKSRLENDLEEKILNGDAEAEEMLKSDAMEYDEKGVGVLTTALRESNELVQQAGILTSLYTRKGLDFNAGFGNNGTVSSLLDEVYEMAGSIKLWSVIRQVSGIKKKVADSLAPAVTEMLVRGKDVVVGLHGKKEFIIYEPIAPNKLTNAIFEYCPDFREAVLQQEIISYLAPFIVSMPELFDHMLRIRLGSLIEAMKSDLYVQYKLTSRKAATAKLMTLSPFAVKCLLRHVLEDVDECPCVHEQFKLLHIRTPDYQEIPKAVEHGFNCTATSGRWLQRRYRLGLLMRINPLIYDRTFDILAHCKGIYIGDKEMTKPDKEDKVEYYQILESAFNSIKRPERRAIAMELLNVLWMVFVQRIPEISLPYIIHLHRLVDHAVSLFISDLHQLNGGQIAVEDGVVKDFVGTQAFTYNAAADNSETGGIQYPSVVGVEHDLDEQLLRSIFAEGNDVGDSLADLSSEHMHPNVPFKCSTTDKEMVLFCANQRGGKTGTIAYLTKAVMRLVQNSVENEGVCFVS
eukprot:CFRG2148T1